MPATEIIEISSSDDDEGRASTEQIRNTPSMKSGNAAALEEAIRSVPPHRLQNSVTQLCQKIPAAAELLSSLLLTQPSAAKRKLVTRWAMCENCKEEFDVAHNEDDEGCAFHGGAVSTISLRSLP